MSVEDQIARIRGNIVNAYAQAAQKGAALPEAQNSENLPSAIASIPISTMPPSIKTITLTANDSEYGTVSLGGLISAGALAIARAYPKNGGVFEGWYKADTLVSENSDYVFEVSDDTTLQAKFGPVPLGQLPKTYKKLEYIQNTYSTNTNIALNLPKETARTHLFVINFEIDLSEIWQRISSGTCYLFGFTDTTNTGYPQNIFDLYVFRSKAEDDTRLGLHYGWQNAAYAVNATLDTTSENKEYSISLDYPNLKAICNGVTIGLRSAGSITRNNVKTFKLFTTNYYYSRPSSGPLTDAGNSFFKFKSLKVYNSQGVLEYDYVPCVNDKGEVGVYDTMNRWFGGSCNSNSLVAGPEN